MSSLPFFAKKEAAPSAPPASKAAKGQQQQKKADAGSGAAASTGGRSTGAGSSSSIAGSSSSIASSSSSKGSSSSSSSSKGSHKVEHKAVYDLAKKELKNRTEVKLSSGAKLGINFSDKTNLVSMDAEKGPFRLGYDFQREDAVFQYTRKHKAGTFKFRQVVPQMHWEVVPSPVVELSTKLLDNSKLKDNLKLVYDFNNRFAYYTETLKFQKKFKVRVAGDTRSTDPAYCVGFKPDARWMKSIKVVHTPSTGPLLSYKLKPASGWKVASEASLRSKTLAASVTYKAQKGETELVLDAAAPLPGNTGKVKLLQKAGVKMNFYF